MTIDELNNIAGAVVKPKVTDDKPVSRPDPGELDASIYDFTDGGIIPAVMDYTISQAPRPNPPLALAGAITIASHIMGRRFKAEDGTSPNIYLIALANSGCGKDFPRKVNRNIALEIGMVGTVCDAFASGGGLEDSVLMNTKVLAQYDEIDTLFRAMKNDKNGNSEPMSAMMLSLYGDSGSNHSRRQLSAVSQAKSAVPNYCIYPSLTIFGTAIPKQFFSSMSERMMTNGLFARCILLPTGGRPKLNEVKHMPLQASLVEAIRSFAGCTYTADGAKVISPEMKAQEKPDRVTVPFAEDLRPLLKQSSEDYDRQWDETESDAEKSIFARSQEKIIKLSLVFAVSENWQRPVITKEHFFRAKSIVDFSNRKSMYLASRYCADNDFHELQQKVIRHVSRGGKCGIHRFRLLKNIHLPVSQFTEVITSLIETGEIVEVSGSSAKNVRYILGDEN